MFRSDVAGARVPLLEGGAVDAMSDPALLARLGGDAVFARIDPRQKLRIVQERGPRTSDVR